MCWIISKGCGIDRSAAADWIVALTTLGALVLAIRQLRDNAKAAGQAHARQAWMAYLQLGAQYPQFGSTEIAMRLLKVKSVDELYEKGAMETERYWWFLDNMLEAMEALVVYFPEQDWKNTIEFNLRLHREAVRYRWPETHMFFSEALCRIAEGVLKPNADLVVEPHAIPASNAAV